jgi:hypothetical protein
MRIAEGVSVFQLAANMGTSVEMLEDLYGKKRMRDSKVASEITRDWRRERTALLLVPPETRLGLPVDRHFRDHQDMYLGKRRLVRTLDVRPVTQTHERVVDYVFKTILRGRVPYDEGVLVLPRARDELAPAEPRRDHP